MQVSQGSDLALRVFKFSSFFMCILFLLFTATKRQNIYHTGAQTINWRNCSQMYISCTVFSSAFHSFPVLFFQNDSLYIIKNEVKLQASSRQHLQLHWIFALPAALSWCQLLSTSASPTSICIFTHRSPVLYVIYLWGRVLSSEPDSNYSLLL